MVAHHNPNAILTYTLAPSGDTPQGAFTINTQTAQILVGSAASLNHEVPTPSFQVTVTATDPEGDTGNATVTIQVTDVDEPPSVPASSTTDTNADDCNTAAITIAENVDKPKELCTYTSNDQEGSDVAWSLSGTDAADFKIDSGGKLSFRSEPDFENPGDSGSDNTYNVTVRASDRTGNVSSLDLTVGVTNVAETGEITFERVQAAVGVNFTAKLVDPDGRASRPSDDNLTSDANWQWKRCTLQGSGCTNIDANATSATYRPVADDATNYLRATVTYRDGKSGATPETLEKDVAYQVLAADSDNKRPTFTNSSVTVSIPEDSTSATTIVTVKAGDENNDQMLTHTLSGGSASPFEIGTDSGVITLRPGASLDYESGRRSYRFTVQASDPFRQTASASVTVNVTNVAEPPEFDDPETKIYYKEHATSAVATFDADDPERSTVIWSLTGDSASSFAITQRGVLSFKSPPVHSCTASDNQYAVTVNASDGAKVATHATTVVVENVEDDGVVKLSSLQPQEDTVLTASLTDADGGYGDAAACANKDLTSDTASQTRWQWARSADGRTWVDIVEDASESSYTPVEDDVGKFLRATATYRDNRSTDWETKTAAQVSANKVSIRWYSAPRFEDATGKQLTGPVTRTINENSPAGSPVGAPVAATHNAGQVLTYALEGTDKRSFTIDGHTGQIRVAAGADINHEVKASYSVTVQARDADPTAVEMVVTISVNDLNEYPSVITGSRAVSFTEKNQDAVGTYTIRPEDGEDQTGITWTLSGVDADDFSVSSTGVLSFRSAPDYEAPTDSGRNNNYHVNVIAADAEGKSASLAVTVTVTNEQEPGSVALSTVQPEVKTSLSAALSDPDGVRSGTTTWQWSRTKVATSPCPTEITASEWEEITGATSVRYTPVTGDTGHCLLATATYRDALASNRSARSDSSVHPVQARDTANQSPVFPNENASQTITVAENATGDVGTRIVASDEGGGDNLTYTLGGTDAASFDIAWGDTAGTAGQISVAAGTKLDHETKSTYRVTVTATDPSAKKASVSVTIKVSDVNEVPALTLDSFVVSGVATVDYPETETGSVATYAAAGTKAAGVTWSLSGTDAADFRISSAGVLTFVSQPNFESPADSNRNNVYEVTVRARNKFGNHALRSVTVSVGNVDEPGQVSLSRTSPGIGNPVTASLTDPDGGISAIAWQWSRSLDGATRFTDIAGANSATYRPVTDDAGKYLRATVSYSDSQGTGKTARTVTTSPVSAVPDSDGRVTLSATTPSVGSTVTATLTDSDAPVANIVWQWSSAAAATGPWIDVAGASTASYTPSSGDVGQYLRAQATYDDAIGFDKTASAVTTAAVTQQPDTEGTVSLSTTRPTAGTEFTATLIDPDTPIANLSWQWYASGAATGPWTTIVGATSASLTPSASQVGRYLRVQASYDDARGTGKSVAAVAANAVRQAQSLLTRYDANGNGQIDRPEVITAISDYLSSGTLTRAETIEVISLYLAG